MGYTLIEELTEAKDNFERELESANNALESANNEIKPFRDTLEIYKRYQAMELLNENAVLRRIIPTDTPVHFLVCGCRASTVSSLWDEMRNLCEDSIVTERIDWKTMLDTLRFLLDCYNLTFDRPELVLIETGGKFDDKRHIRAKESSLYAGEVERVLLPGIWNQNKGTAFRKSVVIVR